MLASYGFGNQGDWKSAEPYKSVLGFFSIRGKRYEKIFRNISVLRGFHLFMFWGGFYRQEAISKSKLLLDDS